MIKRILHFIAVTLAAVPWLIGVTFFGLALALVIIADWLWPDADHGNCWSYAAPRWYKHGGYLLIRPAINAKLVAGVGLVPHVIWVKNLSADTYIEQSEPIDRYSGNWLLWHKLYFKFNVVDAEKVSHKAREPK